MYIPPLSHQWYFPKSQLDSSPCSQAFDGPLVPVRCCLSYCSVWPSMYSRAHLPLQPPSPLPFPHHFPSHPHTSVAQPGPFPGRLPCAPLSPCLSSLLPFLGYFSTPPQLLSIFPGSGQTPPLPKRLPSLTELRMSPSFYSTPFLRFHYKTVAALVASSLNWEPLSPSGWGGVEWKGCMHLIASSVASLARIFTNSKKGS